MPDKAEATVAPVRSDDPQPDKKDQAVDGEGKEEVLKPVNEEELSEEDLALKSELEMLIERLGEADVDLYTPALQSLTTLIRTSTASMTSVPKPLKFLHPHFQTLQDLYKKWDHQQLQQRFQFADILSVLAMTYSDSGEHLTLRYRLQSNNDQDPGLWGHEYVRHLAAEIGAQYSISQAAEKETFASTEQLLALAHKLVPFLLAHNGEADAVDLLLELENIPSIVEFINQDSFTRVGLYMTSCVNLLVPPDDKMFLRTAREIYIKFDRLTEALVCSIRMGDMDAVKEVFEKAKNPNMKKQLAYMIARAQLPSDVIESEDEEILSILSNSQLSSNFQNFGKTLSLVEPKSLDDIYKSHLDNNTRTDTSANVDSARGNLAGTFVNAFVNVGFGNDKLMAKAEEGQSWVYKNKEDGMLSAAASLGMSFLWDPEMGLDAIDKFTYVSEEYIKAGAMLANGIIHSGTRTEADAAFALLEEHTESKSVPLRISSTIGLGLAYAGTRRLDILEKLLPAVGDTGLSMEIASMTALALGFIFVGSANGEITGTIIQTLMERTDEELKEKWARFMGLALALLYIGRQDDSDATIEALRAIEAPIGLQTSILVEVCSFAGTGNVLKIQQLLHHCNDHADPEKKDEAAATHQAFAVIGIALIAMGEDVGADMSIRQFGHLMHYGDPVIRAAVPLAIGLISVSNPQLNLLEILSKYSHDQDLAVAQSAIFAMGLVGAGTNNARLAQMLRLLAVYYHKEADCLFLVRVSQGLVHMGKGMIGISPFHTDRQIMSPVAVAGLLSTIMAFTSTKEFILEKQHWMFYFLVTAMYPQFLVTLSESSESLPTSVRVGKALDVVGQAGKPKTITGFQTHTTPVRLNSTSERAELGTEEWISYTHVLEGFAILAKNKGYENEEETTKMDTSS